jgi:8-oxo-dGTP pyrophosphatase MutT (NUDIX family)
MIGVLTELNIFSGIAESVQLLFRRPRREQFAALCYRLPEGQAMPEILVLTSRDTGRWVIPKGWPMGKKPGHEVARQEAMEEAGVVGDADREPLGYFCYKKNIADDFAVPCQVEVYPLKVISELEEFKEKGKRKIEWVSPAVAISRVREPQLKRLIDRFAERFDSAAA